MQALKYSSQKKQYRLTRQNSMSPLQQQKNLKHAEDYISKDVQNLMKYWIVSVQQQQIRQ